MAALRGFIKEAWAAGGLTDAVELASPSLAAAVAALPGERADVDSQVGVVDGEPHGVHIGRQQPGELPAAA